MGSSLTKKRSDFKKIEIFANQSYKEEKNKYSE